MTLQNNNLETNQGPASAPIQRPFPERQGRASLQQRQPTLIQTSVEKRIQTSVSGTTPNTKAAPAFNNGNLHPQARRPSNLAINLGSRRVRSNLGLPRDTRTHTTHPQRKQDLVWHPSDDRPVGISTIVARSGGSYVASHFVYRLTFRSANCK